MNALPQQYSLKWNDYHSSVTAVFNALRACQELVDVSLCCEGRTVKAHKVLLSACSPYFRDLFKENPCQHPVFFLKGGSFADLCCVLEFMYRGEVHVGQRQLSSFLKTAELLQVKGLSASSSEPRAVEEDFEEAEVDEEEEEQDGDDDEDAQEDDDQHHHENDADMDDDVILTHDSLHARADAVNPQRRSVPPSTAAAAVSSLSSRKRPLPRLTPRPNSPAARSARHATKAAAAGRGASPSSKRARSPAPACVKTGSSVVSASSGVGGGGTLVDSIANSLKSTATEVSACGGGGGGGVSATTARISSVAAARRRQRRHKHTPDDETKRQAGAVSDKDASARARHSNHHHSHHHNNSASDENPGDGEMDSVDDSLEAAAGAADESAHKIDVAVEECSVPPQTTQGTSVTAAAAGNGKNTASVVSAAGDDTISSLSSPISAAEAKPTGGEWDSRRGAFRCPYCNRLYTHLVSLGQHMKVHQGDTTCHVCGKVLSRTTQLRIHLRQIHGVGHDDAQQQQQQQQQQAASASSTSS